MSVFPYVKDRLAARAIASLSQGKGLHAAPACTKKRNFAAFAIMPPHFGAISNTSGAFVSYSQGSEGEM
jgi:hypothetical protein